jgi:thiosulfate reductase cytochrome b subunit
MTEKLYLYPIWLRIWHASNAILIILLIITGISLQYSTNEYIRIRFDLAVSIHNVSGILLVINYLFFIIGNYSTRNIRYYILEWKGLPQRIMQQSMYYLSGMFKGEKSPFPVSKDRKFNPLQKVSYVVTMYLFVPIVMITGIALLFPETILPRFLGFSGIQLTALLHAVAGFLISIFLVVHVYICTTGKPVTKNFKSIVTGWHE